MPTTFPLSMTLFCLWIVIAAVLAMLPGKYHWRGAYGLIAVIGPLLIYIWWDLGGWYALGATLAAMSVLRWPVRFVFRWVRARIAALRGQDG